MDLRITCTENRARRAFTLVEMLFTLGVATVVLAGVLAFLAFSNRSFASLTNYLDLDQQTQLALDKMSREIRQAANLTSFNSTNLTLTANNGGTLSYTYDRVVYDGLREKSAVAFTSHQRSQIPPIIEIRLKKDL